MVKSEVTRRRIHVLRVITACGAALGISFAATACGLPETPRTVAQADIPNDSSAATVLISPTPDAQKLSVLLMREGTTDIAGIREEYREAIEAWPYSFPSGYGFPPESRAFIEPESATEWEYGSGVAEAYFWWQGSCAYAAYLAHARGDDEIANTYLDELAEAYDSGLRRSIIGDPTGSYLTAFIFPAKDGGNYAPILEALVGELRSDRVFQAMVEDAGGQLAGDY